MGVADVSLLDVIGLVGAGGWREGRGRGEHGPAVYGSAGIRAAAMWRKSAASGQAAAKARRTREAVSMTRVPSFKRRKRIVWRDILRGSRCPLSRDQHAADPDHQLADHRHLCRRRLGDRCLHLRRRRCQRLARFLLQLQRHHAAADHRRQPADGRVNSAVASACAAGIASRIVRISQ